jgi:hypothetical protein
VATEADRKDQEKRELLEILSPISRIARLTLSFGEVAISFLSTKCVKGSRIKYVNNRSKCPNGSANNK